jgi:hypothetical protein
MKIQRVVAVIFRRDYSNSHFRRFEKFSEKNFADKIPKVSPLIQITLSSESSRASDLSALLEHKARCFLEKNFLIFNVRLRAKEI